MTRLTRTLALLLAICTLVLCGCQQEKAPTELTYSVRVINAAGEAYTTGVIVRILKETEQVSGPATEETEATEEKLPEETEATEAAENLEQVAMKAVSSDGKVEIVLPIGEYTVELNFTGEEANYYYDRTCVTLTAEQPSLEICLYDQAVYDSQGKKGAFTVATGDTSVKLSSGQRNYFLYAPETAGTYQITTSDPKATVGNYGYTAYIMANSISEVQDNVMTISITKSMVGSGGSTNPFVIGVDADGISECVLKIERIGDPAYSIEEDEPWIIYEPTVELSKFTTPKGTLKYFDLTASSDTYNLVFNENDKTYHLGTADGPQVLVQLAKPTTYLDAISTICTTAGISKYFYDDNGNFVKRENYTKCLQIYSCTKLPTEGDRVQSAGTAVYLDPATGLYPLTEDLKYIIQNHGEYAGWWDKNDNGYLFQDADGNKLVGLNPDIAWLFLCCYVEA